MRGWRVLLAATLVLGACNGGRGGASDTTLPPRASTTASTAPDYSVPEVIDVAYVEKVMAALDHVYGDAIRILARDRQITQDFLEHLAAIYGERFFRLVQRSWSEEVRNGLTDVASAPGDPRADVVRLIRSDRQCIVAAVNRDFAAIRRSVPVNTPQRFIGLVPAGRRTNPINPTTWILAYDGWNSDGSEPIDPCRSE